MQKQPTKIKFANWNEMPWEPIREGVDRKIFGGGGATLQLSRLKHGHAPQPHKHPYEQMIYILSGSCDLHVGDDTYPLVSGSCLAIPTNVFHYAEVTGDKEVLILDLFMAKLDDVRKWQSSK